MNYELWTKDPPLHTSLEICRYQSTGLEQSKYYLYDRTSDTDKSNSI